MSYRVMTWFVIWHSGSAKSLARPKSAILSCPSEARSKLLGFKSYKNKFRTCLEDVERICKKAIRIWYTRCNMKFRWQNSSPRNVMAIQLLISAGKNTSDLSLMIISRSESRNSRTRFKFVFEEKTSRSYIYYEPESFKIQKLMQGECLRIAPRWYFDVSILVDISLLG